MIVTLCSLLFFLVLIFSIIGISLWILKAYIAISETIGEIVYKLRHKYSRKYNCSHEYIKIYEERSKDWKSNEPYKVITLQCRKCGYDKRIKIYEEHENNNN